MPRIVRTLLAALLALTTLLAALAPAGAVKADGVALPVAATLAAVMPSTPPEPAIAEPTPDAPTHDALASALGEGRVITGTTAHRALHFTFDDGPGEGTPRLLDTLDAHHAHATFFLVARQLEHARGRRIAQEIAARGHTIGLHSYAHDDVTTLSAAALASDIARSEAIFEDVLGGRPHLYRPPYGHHDDGVDAVLAAHGYTEVLWNITANDAHARTADEVVDAFRSSLDQQERMPRGQGGIVLIHDTHRWVVDALPRLFDEIDARNCAALAAGEELWDVRGDLSAWHQARGSAAATRHADRMRLSDDDFAVRQAALAEEATMRCSHE